MKHFFLIRTSFTQILCIGIVCVPVCLWVIYIFVCMLLKLIVILDSLTQKRATQTVWNAWSNSKGMVLMNSFGIFTVTGVFLWHIYSYKHWNMSRGLRNALTSAAFVYGLSIMYDAVSELRSLPKHLKDRRNTARSPFWSVKAHPVLGISGWWT